MATRNTTRGKRRKPARRRSPDTTTPAVPAPPDTAEAFSKLHEARSIFACVALCLDEIVDPLDVEEEAEPCDPSDVAAVVRAGLRLLDEAREGLDSVAT